MSYSSFDHTPPSYSLFCICSLLIFLSHPMSILSMYFFLYFLLKKKPQQQIFLVSLKNLKEQPSSKPPSLHTLFYKFTFLPFSLYNIQNGTLMSSVNKTYLNGINPFYVLLFVKSFLYTKIK